MSRNNEKNIIQHNDKLHKTIAKSKKAILDRKEKLKQIIKKHNCDNHAND